MIDQTTIIHSNADIHKNVSIGPYSVIGENVSIGSGTVIGSHVVITGPTTIGPNNKIFHFSSIGEDPQDKKFNEDQNSYLEIGANNTIREYVSINRGTSDGGGKTIIGSNNWIMAYVHIAHDCIVGDNVIMANMATLGGHVELGNWAFLGGGVLVHQFCKVGEHALIAAGFRAVQDVPPFIWASGEPIKYSGINSVGLKRRGFSSEERRLMKQIYTLYFRSMIPRTKIQRINLLH